MNKIKKAIKNILCNDLSGSLLTGIFGRSMPDIRWWGFRFRLPAKGVSKTNIASIFWGFYESAEIRFVQKYLDGNLDVVEMGGSLGIVGSHIVSRLKPGKKFISVEANPFLIDNIEKNLHKYARPGVKYKALNKAVQYHVDEVAIHVSSDNTASHVDRRIHSGVDTIMTGTITLGNIIRNEQLKDFALVCDIEGSEIELILYDLPALICCKQIFLELHDVNHNGVQYSPDDMLNKLLQTQEFELVAREGPVCLLQKKP